MSESRSELIDEPSPFATLATWEHHLSALKRLPDDTTLKQDMIAHAEQMVAALKNDNLLWRLHAQRLLVERGKRDVVPDLVKLVGDSSLDEIGLNPGAIHALWTLHGLGVRGVAVSRVS